MDIVERLRRACKSAYSPMDVLAGEAADEIERLRRQLSHAEQLVEGYKHLAKSQ